MSPADPAPLPFKFTKARAESLIKRIGTGKPITPEDGWDFFDLISAASALLLMAGVKCPTPGRVRMCDLCAAATFGAELTELVITDLYDVDFEPEVTAEVVMLDDGRPDVTFITGFKT
ncbi:MAG: hypothetical protein ACYSTY_05870 [Planctomycetota bacterium]|jgi:ribonuclease PH